MKYRKNLTGSATYYSAMPTSLFDINLEIDEPLKKLIADTEQALSQLDERTAAMGEDELSTLLHREAELSWMLSAGETIPLFSLMWTPPMHSKEDEDDIANLERATRWASDMMDELPVSRRLLTDAHYLACGSERYDKKYRGEFRKSPVWIGDTGRKLQDKGVFVPPVDDDMIQAFTHLEQFIHYADSVHPLVRVALAHYQFETIHPFIDANGRLGRLLTQLMLIDYGYQHHPTLQLSEQLSRHSVNYYYMIQQTHTTGNYLEWVRFFILCLKKAAMQA